MYARYTAILRDLMKNKETMDLLNEALSTYPLYEPKSKNDFLPNVIPTREELNQKLLNAYKYREIGFETVGRFLDELEIAMCEIMPYYNQIFVSQDQDFNIIHNVDYTKQTDIERSSNTTGSSSGNNTTNTTSSNESNNDSNTSNTHSDTNTSTGKNVNSKTPQDSLSISGEDINSIRYADDANWNKVSENNSGNMDSNTEFHSTSNSTNNTTDNSTRQHDDTTTGSEGIKEVIKGNFGVVSAQDLVDKYRKTILNTVQMIINDKRIKELFMNVY